jgi:hypothetical protein
MFEAPFEHPTGPVRRQAKQHLEFIEKHGREAFSDEE